MPPSRLSAYSSSVLSIESFHGYVCVSCNKTPDHHSSHNPDVSPSRDPVAKCCPFPCTVHGELALGSVVCRVSVNLGDTTLVEVGAPEQSAVGDALVVEISSLNAKGWKRLRGIIQALRLRHCSIPVSEEIGKYRRIMPKRTPSRIASTSLLSSDLFHFPEPPPVFLHRNRRSATRVKDRSRVLLLLAGHRICGSFVV